MGAGTESGFIKEGWVLANGGVDSVLVRTHLFP